MGREWVPFLKEEIDELYQLLKSRVGDAYPDELLYKLIDIVESATFVEIDFGELMQCLEGCQSGYKILESQEALNDYKAQNPGTINYMLAYRAYNIQNPQSSIENFALWAEDVEGLISEKGLLVLACSFTEGASSDFYLISNNNNYSQVIDKI